MRFWVTSITGFVIWLLVTTCLWGASLPTQLNLWKGEYLRTNQGAITMQILLEEFTRNDALRGQQAEVQVIIRDRISGQRYLILVPTINQRNFEQVIWKAPVGTYRVEGMTYYDRGRKRVWFGSGQERFAVRSMMVANMGLVRVRPRAKNYLQVRFNAFKPKLLAAAQSGVFGGVLEAFSGRSQQSWKGGMKATSQRNNFGRVNEMRAVITQSRSVSMVYKMDLRQFARYNRSVLPVLQGHDARLRSCYTDRLEENDRLGGTVSFRFILTKRTGTVRKLTYTGGTIKDGKMIKCLYYELAQLHFPVRAPVDGRLTFQFRAF